MKKLSLIAGVLSSVMEQGRHQVQASVDIASSAGDSLKAITASASKIMEMNTLIATASEEQSNVSEEINKNIVSINDVAEKTGLVATQSLESSEALSHISKDLQALISKFRI